MARVRAETKPFFRKMFHAGERRLFHDRNLIYKILENVESLFFGLNHVSESQSEWPGSSESAHWQPDLPQRI